MPLVTMAPIHEYIALKYLSYIFMEKNHTHADKLTILKNYKT